MGNKLKILVTVWMAVLVTALLRGQTSRLVLAVDDQYKVAQGAKLVVPARSGLKFNDVGAATLNLSVHRFPNHGTVACDSSGAFTYQPLPNFQGYDSFTYDLVDASSKVVASANVQIRVLPSMVMKLDLGSPQAVSGETLTGWIRVSESGQSGGLELPVSYVNCSGPASVLVGAGQTDVAFGITSAIVPVDSTATVTVNPGPNQVSQSFSVAAPRVASIDISQCEVFGGSVISGCVNLSQPAGAAGIWVGLDTSYGSVAPAAMYVAPGKSSARFSIPTQPVVADVSGWIEAHGFSSTRRSLTVKAPRLSKVLLPSTGYVGQLFTGTVVLGSPAPQNGLSVALTCDGATGISRAYVSAGQTVGSFSGVPNDIAQVQLKAQLLDSSVSGTVPVIRPGVGTLELPSTVSSGALVTGKVTLTRNAGPSGTVVSLSGAGLAGLPSSVAVSAGSKTATFTFTSPTVSITTDYSVQAQAGGASQTAKLSVLPYVQLSSISLPSSVAGGATVTGSITLNSQALSGGLTVSIQAPGLTGVPTSVTVPAGQNSVSFTFTSPLLSDAASYTLQATANSVSKSATVTVQSGVQLAALTLPSSAYSGYSITGTVALNMVAGKNGSVVALSCTNLSGLPSSVTIPAGQQTATFSVTAPSVQTQTSYLMNAVGGGTTKSATVQVSPVVLTGLTLPTSAYGGTTVTGTVTLNTPAGANGLVVSLSGGNVSGLSGNVTVPAGQQSATFTFVAPNVSVQSLSLVIATAGSVSKSSSVTILPTILVSSITSDSPNYAQGDTVKLTVTLSTAASSGGVLVSLSSNDSCVSVPATMTVPQGSKTATVSVKTTTPSKTVAQVTVSASIGSSKQSCTFNVKKG